MYIPLQKRIFQSAWLLTLLTVIIIALPQPYLFSQNIKHQEQMPIGSNNNSQSSPDFSFDVDAPPLGACNASCDTPDRDGSGSLGNSYNYAACGLNYTQATLRLGQRFSPAGAPQPATFSITGLPIGATILQAYVYTSMSGSGIPVNVTITNPSAVTGTYPMTLIGSGPDKCWGYSGSHTYRGDVTAAITTNGNYVISGLPTNPPTSGEDTDGATLFIIYQDPAATYTGTLLINDGCVVINGGSTTQSITGFTVCQNATFATAFIMIGDIQFNGSTMTVNNGTPAPYTFDWWNFIEAPTTVTTALSTSSFTISTSGDCYNFAAIGLYWQIPGCGGVVIDSTNAVDAVCNNCNGAATVYSSNAGSYQWDAAAANQTTATATGLCPGTYTVTVTGGSCTTPWDSVFTIVNTGGFTTSITNPVNPSCPGACDGTAFVTATGGQTPYTYAWATNTGQTGTNLCDGWNLVTVTDNAGCQVVDSVQLTDPPPVSFSSFSKIDETCPNSCDGQATVVPAGGSGVYNYAWTPAPGAGQGTANAGLLCNGSYTLTVTDNNGCSHDTTFSILTVNAMTTNTSETASSCSQPDGSATVSGTVGGSSPYSYLWDAGAGSQTGTTATGLVDGTYCVTITDQNNCDFDTCITVSSIPGPSLTANSPTTTCFNGCDGTSNATAVSGTTPYSYLWSTSPSQSSMTATGLCAGNYNVTVTDANNCTDVVTITVSQPSMVSVTPSPDTTICLGGTATISSGGSGGSPGYTFVWDNGNLPGNGPHIVSPVSNTCYNVYAVDANNCQSAPLQVCVNVNPALTVQASADVSICDGNSTIINASGTGGNGGPYVYTWNTAQSTQQITVTPTSYPVSTTYIVSITDGCSAPATDTVVVSFYPTPSISFSVNQPGSCAPGSFNFTNGTANSGFCQWSFGDGNTAVGCASVSNIYNLSGTYDIELIITSNDGCTDTLINPEMVTVYPNPLPYFDFIPNPATVLTPQVVFTDQTVGSPVNWSWTFNDFDGGVLGSSSETSPVFTYPAVPGDYPVDLEVTSSDGCIGDTTLVVPINGVYQFWIPNAFTPNGDGKNDLFVPKGFGVDPDNYHLMIFDRWGEMIFETTDIGDLWDGRAHKFNNNLVPQGVYVYRIETVSIDRVPQNYRYIGHVTVIY